VEGKMDLLLSFFYNAFAYAAFVIFIIGIIYRAYQLKKIPVPLKIPTTPQSLNLAGVAARMAGDVVFFRSLSKGETERALWTAGWLFHVGFLLVVLRHIRYFVYPVPEFVMLIQDAGIIAGVVMFLCIPVLYFRRYANERVRYITSFADLFILILIFLIVVSGLEMKYIARPDLVNIKAFLLGIIFLKPTAVPINIAFLIHFALVMILLMYFPFSKLMHSVGYFLSPTRNQLNNPRTKRHVNPWADRVWDKMINAPRPIDPKTSEPYQPWSQEQWRKRWLKQES
jgi:nitrate reductase gamma subunit